MIKLFCSLNVNRLNILHWQCTTADKFSSAFSSNGFFKGRYFDKKFTTTGRLHTLLPVFL